MSNGIPPMQFPAREKEAHKGDFGNVILCGGSRGMSGSIALSSIAALLTGSGRVSSAVPDRCLETVASFHPCVMTIPLADDGKGCFGEKASQDLASRLSRIDALGCGPGMTTQSGSIRIIDFLVHACKIAMVLDADAINCLSDLDWAKQSGDFSHLVLTPHPGELSRLTGVGAKEREKQIDAAQELASRLHCTIVVKGGPTVVVSENERWTNNTGNPGMATAGTGDVLTGIITSLLGQRLSPWDAARLGVWIHGAAGDLAARDFGYSGMTALELLHAIPLVTKEITLSNPVSEI